jgi:hypothetical protein
MCWDWTKKGLSGPPADNAYDYNYDGKPSEPSPATFDFNLRTGKWETINPNALDPTMDHRRLL